MKSLITSILLIAASISMNAQANIFNEAYRFNKFMDKINTPKGQLTYGDIGGNAYYNDTFVSAKIENATTLINVRYNKYTDTMEILKDGNIYILPKTEKYSKIEYVNSPEVLVYLNSGEMEGYYFELVPGKNRLLKKLKSEFRPEVPAVNSFTSAVAPRFENINPVYYFEINNQFVKVPKNTKDFVNQFSANKDEIAEFIKSNKLKINQEVDLVRIAKFINK
ncbi:hypothetical protein Q73A0000_10315 [Kaistella flava (ex Peng et al. 2021)]|uniref:DUF4384 domain-containing protein n=1 Tax=Kaistella flava (ex Peng et al. 2021) TaxID=2038776 RepID=A0A7M2Y909_9FLAO|nr:hypothetical protein [Kaistella flava (ex Peng et al. 2021)]QOW10737.1 hypothetical protein Q73A0000_10315 [Kaistella flava (ex Peng et al. 2021)]